MRAFLRLSCSNFYAYVYANSTIVFAPNHKQTLFAPSFAFALTNIPSLNMKSTSGSILLYVFTAFNFQRVDHLQSFLNLRYFGIRGV